MKILIDCRPENRLVHGMPLMPSSRRKPGSSAGLNFLDPGLCRDDDKRNIHLFEYAKNTQNVFNEQCEIWHWPLLEILPLQADFASDITIRLENADGVIAVSANAIYGANQYLPNGWPKKPIYAAVGPTTQKLWESFGVHAIAPNEGTGAHALLAREDLQDLKNQRWIVLRAQKGRNDLINALEQRGAEVEVIAAYERKPLPLSQQTVHKLEDALPHSDIRILITSRETLDLLVKQIPSALLAQCQIMVTHETIVEEAWKINLKSVILKKKPTIISNCKNHVDKMLTFFMA